MHDIPLFSVIVSTLDRRDLLEDTLVGLSQLLYRNFEIVVVSGPSEDDTSEFLSHWGNSIKLANSDVANLARSRNIGLSLAAGEFVAFIDDDAVPHPYWLDRLLSRYSISDRIGAVGGYTVGPDGVTFQARKTICDRFGDAYYVSDYFDEAQLQVPGEWIFPSLLGTNCSFRSDALVEIGGFDETFTYFLEETDVCLRLFDRGWKIAYEPTALVWHRFAASVRRNGASVPGSILEPVRSQTYFIYRHGLQPWSAERAIDAAKRLERLRHDWRWSIENARALGLIDEFQLARLNRDLTAGVAEGLSAARGERAEDSRLAPAPVLAIPMKPRESRKLTVCLVSRRYPPSVEAGIGRWTFLLAYGLAQRGHSVHVITEVQTNAKISFRRGVWTHEVVSESNGADWLVDAYGVPRDIALWAETVRRRVEMIKCFGLQIVSFPIWDLEGLGCLDDPDLAIIVSLHTTYGLAQEFRSDWATRPIFTEDYVGRVIAAERKVLERTGLILANSKSVVKDISDKYEIELGARLAYAVHGVPIPMLDATHLPNKSDERPLKVLFVGRFERRKGIDIAFRSIAIAVQNGVKLVVDFVGEELGERIVEEFPDAARLRLHEGVRFRGVLSREELNGCYASSDVVLMPSRYESFGLVAVEAFAYGVPVIVLDGGAPAEFVEHGKTGFLVAREPDPASAIARLLAELASKPEVLPGMGSAARATAVANFSIPAMVDQVETALLSLALMRK